MQNPGVAESNRTLRIRNAAQIAALCFLLQALPLRSVRAEDRLDTKVMYYQEDDNRMQIFAPTFLYRKDLGGNITIKIEGIYNSISGASPTGAPATPGVPPVAPSPPAVSGGGGGGDDDERDAMVPVGARRAPMRFFPYYAGATPPATPSPSSPSPTPPAAGTGGAAGETVPMAEVEDQRFGLNLEVAGRVAQHSPAIQFSGSTEDDYTSLGISLRDAIDFNQKNTTLLLGGAYTHDVIDAITMPSSRTKDTMDLMIGLTQLLGPKAFAQVNISHSRASGYISDPYKVVELNGVLVPENRPDRKNRDIVYLALTRYFESLRGSAEVSYRWYDDSFGVTAHTMGAAWYQKVGSEFIVRPSVRYYTQSAADFFAVRFSGNPEVYSSDYRVSSMDAFEYGLKLIWTPGERFAADIGYDRYEQRGRNSGLPDSVYPAANVVTVGISLWF